MRPDAPAALRRRSGPVPGRSTPVGCLRAEQELITMQALRNSSDRASGSKSVGWRAAIEFCMGGAGRVRVKIGGRPHLD